MDALIHVAEVPWASLGKKLETAPTSTKEIMKELDMSWTVSSHKMSAEDKIGRASCRERVSSPV